MRLNLFNLNRSLISLLLLFCLLAPVAVTLFIVEEHRVQVKKEIKQRLASVAKLRNLVTIKVDSEEKSRQLNWHDSREFEYCGEMYDVIKTVVKGTSTYYTCWLDHEETELNKKLDELVADALGNSTKHRQSKTKLLELFELFYVAENSGTPVRIETTARKQQYATPNTYQSIFLSHPFPPPEAV